MATAVTVVFGANSAQFQAELNKMQTMAATAGRRMSGGFGGGGHGGHAGQTGIVRESTVIGREIAMGRGMGRIIASMTLLAQYINTATRNAKAGVGAAEELANAWDKEALKARISAAALMKKSEALALQAELEGFDVAETIAAADANEMEARTATQAAIALEAKALAERQAAEAAAANAVAVSGGVRAMIGALGIFALLLIVVVELYIVAKALTEILNRKAKADKLAAEYAHDHKLAVWEEAEALEKLRNASEATTEALKKMNLAKNHSVELAKQAMEASKNEADARAKLYDAGVKGKLIDIEIAEKKGMITSRQAIQMKSAIESQSVADKSAAKQKELMQVANIASNAAFNADQDRKVKQEAAQKASDKINKSPEGMKRAQALAAAEKDLSASKSEAEQAKKDLIEYNKGGSNMLYSSSLSARLEGFGGAKDKNAALKETADSKEFAATSAETRVNSLKRFMTPDERDAANALHVAEAATSAAQSLKVDAKKSVTEAQTFAKYSPSEVASEQANIKKQEQLDMLPSYSNKGYSLNSQQQVGAYAATAPVLFQQLAALRVIQSNTTQHAPATNHPPGERKPQFSTKPERFGPNAFAGSGGGY